MTFTWISPMWELKNYQHPALSPKHCCMRHASISLGRMPLRSNQTSVYRTQPTASTNTASPHGQPCGLDIFSSQQKLNKFGRMREKSNVGDLFYPHTARALKASPGRSFALFRKSMQGPVICERSLRGILYRFVCTAFSCTASGSFFAASTVPRRPRRAPRLEKSSLEIS